MRWWDGNAWPTTVGSSAQEVDSLTAGWYTAPGGSGPRTVMICALMVAVVACCGVGCGGHVTDGDRWSSLPHSMGCVITPPAEDSHPPDSDPIARFEPLPDSLRVQQVRLAHTDGDRIELEVEFAERVPPTPSQAVRSPLNGALIDGPGSVTYGIVLHNNGTAIVFDSPSSRAAWKAGSFDNNTPIPLTVHTADRVVTLSADLSGQDNFLGTGPFRPEKASIIATTMEWNPQASTGMTSIGFDGQDCLWSPPNLRPGEATIPSASSAAPGPPSPEPNPTAHPNELSLAEQRYINDLATIGVHPTSTVKALAETGPKICELVTDAYRRNGSPMAGIGIKNSAASGLKSGSHNLSWEAAQAWVQAAIDHFCPDSQTGMHLQ